MQFGATLVKPLFLVVDRDLVPWKPESALQLYTKVFAPEQWAIGGSLPVAFPSEMFMNFGFLGVLPLAGVFALLNRIFSFAHSVCYPSLRFYSAVFLSTTVLMLARGSGLEQHLLYLAFGTLVFIGFDVYRWMWWQPNEAEGSRSMARDR
jgi:hypothetical protein